ncbi:MAG: hypothetical protein ABEH43_04770, partial [Flavobacteriales bacterium]
KVNIYFNGNTSPGTTIQLSGTLANDEVFVLCDDDAGATFTNLSDQLSGDFFFNGDDAVELIHNGNTIDVIGQIGTDPGSEWGSGDQSTQDNTLTRKCSLTCPSDTDGSDSFDPANEWNGYVQDFSDSLGVHGCGSGGNTSDTAVRLNFNTLPEVCLEPGDAFSVKVCAVDAGGDIDSNFTGEVNLSKVSGSGNLSGTLSDSATNGCVTFNDL